MAYQLPAHLHRNRHGILYFRMAVPNMVRHILSQKEIYRSLRTSSVRQAKQVAQSLTVELRVIFGELENMHVSESASPARQMNLTRLSDLMRSTKRLLQQEARFEELQASYRHGQHRIQKLTAEIGSQRAHHERFAELAVHAARNGAGENVKPKGLLFPEALDAFYELAQIKPTTKRTYRGRLNDAQDHFGQDRDVRYIEQSDLSDYALHVKRTVSNEVTQGHYIRTFTSFLNFLRANKGWGPELTTKTLLPKKSTPDSDDRDGFTLEQMGVIFEHVRQYRETNPCKYWATLGIAFTGCRIEELAQIHLERDLLQDINSGTWYINLNGRPDPDGSQRRTLKNPASWRCVPIHSALVDHGFIEFLVEQKEAGFVRPFESNWKANIFEDGKAYKWSHYVTNWGGRELAKLRDSGLITDPECKLSYFHSMRHLVSQLMGRAKVPAEVAEAALGHKYAGGERERYNKLKSDPVQLSREGFEPGLMALAEIL